MSEWKKVENPVTDDEARTPAPEEQPSAGNAAEAPTLPEAPAEEASADDTADKEPPAKEATPSGGRSSSARYAKNGRRRGRYRYAAPVGLVVILLAAVGVVTLVTLGVQGIRRATDDTALKAEIFDFIEPLVQNAPVTAFTDVTAEQQDALILSAIWKLTSEETIRMQYEKDDVCRYAQTSDGTGRVILPIEEVNEAYASLYGPDAVPYLHTIGDEGGGFSYEYKAEENCYYVPLSLLDSRYQAVSDTLTKKGGQYTLRVGFVPVTSIGIDQNGDTIEPTPAMAEYFQLYTVEKTEDDSWKIVAVADDAA